MDGRLRRASFASLAIAIGLGVSVVAGEIGLRIIGFEFHPYPATVQFGWPDPIAIEERYQLDEDLLWVPKQYDATLSRWAGAGPTIAHLGDSCTEFGRYDEHLETLVLGERPESDYSFVNLGVGGWSSYQGRSQMERDVVRIRPDIATLYFGWNDHWRAFELQDRDIGDFIRAYPRWLLALARSRLTQLVMRADLSRRRRAATEGSVAQERVSPADFESNLVAMVGTARQAGIVPVLMTAPTSHEIGREPAYLVPNWLDDLSRLVPLHREYVDVVREVSRAHDVHLIDLFAEFGRLEPTDRQGYFNEDGIHLNERGNERIAAIMYEHLEAFDLLPRLGVAGDGSGEEPRRPR